MAETVCEGAGDHCCEYMTGGAVVMIGTVGRNVAAGMTGGLGYFYDEDGTFCSKVNAEIVSLQKVVTAAGEAHLKRLLEEHLERTGSVRAQRILDDWANELHNFWQLVPPSEKDVPEASVAAEMPAAVAAQTARRRRHSLLKKLNQHACTLGVLGW
eukprot:TRINITY_DN18980_c0_g1_i3.p2 TRINITY_DN18980_c0_g1~~TRINITY_DN18980_c0_g1_i3.p2  ORF type:complete len:156 (-),score=35.64 TRINITY_DN18980_c0_g1_i3:526-993(-)